MNRNGMTLVEVLIVVGMVGVMAAAASKLYEPISVYFLQGQARQRGNFEARVCLDTIGMALRQGLARSAQISTPNTLPLVQNSQIIFNPASTLASGTTTYQFTLLPNGKVQMLEFTALGAAPKSRILASDVSNLAFFNGDTWDPSIVYVTLQIDIPIGAFIDASGQPAHTTTIQINNEEFHMRANPG